MKFPALTTLTIALFTTGCASMIPITGTVYKQEDGSYKAAYSAGTEEKVRKTLHSDATKTCKNKFKAQEFIVVEEEIKKIEKDNDGTMDKAVNLAGKFFDAESVSGSLVFKCDMDTVKKGFL